MDLKDLHILKEDVSLMRRSLEGAISSHAEANAFDTGQSANDTMRKKHLDKIAEAKKKYPPDNILGYLATITRYFEQTQDIHPTAREIAEMLYMSDQEIEDHIIATGENPKNENALWIKEFASILAENYPKNAEPEEIKDLLLRRSLNPAASRNRNYVSESMDLDMDRADMM